MYTKILMMAISAYFAVFLHFSYLVTKFFSKKKKKTHEISEFTLDATLREPAIPTFLLSLSSLSETFEPLTNS